jgi:hypothetical protein
MPWFVTATSSLRFCDDRTGSTNTRKILDTHHHYFIAHGCPGFYGIMPGRGYDEAVRFLGAEYGGFLVHDGWSIYYRFENAFHQSCTRHLINRCNEMIESSSPAAARFPSNVKTILLKGLDLRDRFLNGGISKHGMASATGRIETSMDRLLRPTYRSPQYRRLAKHMDHEYCWAD